MLKFANFIKSPKSTVAGLVVGAVQAAAGSAVVTYQSTGNTTDWVPYATSAGIGALTFIFAGLSQDPDKK